MPRTTVERVRDIILIPENVDLTSYIEIATDITDKVEANDTSKLMTEGLLKHIETLLAAHYYSLLDPQANQKKVGDASESYNERDWWKEAVKLDLTGTLAAMTAGSPTATITYLGTQPSRQRDAWDR